MKQKGLWLLITAIICGVVSLLGAFDALGNVKLVTIITAIARAFGSGAALVSAVHNLKQSRESLEN